MSQSPEKVGVELPAISWLIKLGYTHLPGNQVQVEHRHLAPVLDDVLQARLLILNPWLASAPGGISAALIELRKRVNDELLPANKAFWEQVVNRSNIQVKDVEGKLRSVRFFDASNAANNDFHVVDQYVGRNADGDIFRPDLLLFVNGLPLAIIECKASHHRLDEALGQLDGYQNSFPTQFVFNQVCVGLNRREGLYGAILAKPAYYARYRLQAKESAAVTTLLGDAPSEQESLLWALFEPSRFLQLITHFVLFETRDGKTKKKLPRYQQWRAVRKTVDRLCAPKTMGGVVWHTQGSGKSLTMALLARMLRADSTGLNNPTVLVLTDRKDLDKQIFDTFHAVGISAIQAVSVDGLLKMLSNDYGSVFTSTVQKFQENEQPGEQPAAIADEEDDALQATRHRRIREEKDFIILHERNVRHRQVDENGVLVKAKWEEISREKVDFRVLSTKSNFYVLVDEAHRSQYDFLAAFMRASLPNAKFIAFTGTPLLQEDKHTLGEFGGGEYIDEYRLHEAVADGATLPIKYQDAWVALSANAELDTAFKEQFAKQTEIRQHELKRELLRRWRQAGNRMEQVAEHLVEHFLSNVKAKGLKAMLVCAGRDMAVGYKDLLDAIMAERVQKGLPTFDSKVVISLASITASRTGASAMEEASEYEVDLDKIQSIEERVKAEVKAGKNPVAVPSEQIGNFVSKLFPLPYGEESSGLDGEPQANKVGLIIVSDMLLTGWDAPIVGTMYLDKPLKEHTLLQAIARVNRTLPGKNAGYIVDYHGVVEHLDHALKIYGGEVKPSQVWAGVETELPKLQATLDRILKLLPKKNDPVAQREGYKTDAECFLDPAIRLDMVEEFLDLVKQFNRSVDIILPDVRGVPFKPYFTLLGEIRLMLRDKLPGNTYKERITKLESVMLQQLLDEYVAASPAKSLLGHEVSILDASDMARLKQLASPGSRALVMKNQLKHTIATGQDKDPAFFDKLAEELEKLLEEEKAGRITQAKFLQQLELFSRRIQEKDNTGFIKLAHSAVYHYLAALLAEDTARVATTKLFEDEELSRTVGTDNWKKMPDLHPDIRDHLRGLLMPLAGWERSVARDHAKRILDILLKN
ncbi:type I restriction endonuclease [Pseudomonas syringae pv. actinidiae]|uniref:type I site-specific deoxyribonuclease n=1 Tax=Pseudomonas syringae pv. actinidiae TaxID=103796 RepID=A0AAN4TI21_PSESF|nr:type I restriction endonuclease [Pseudomonas syringae]EPN57429.1 HsdR family type I site-specific deoxyribonuclease [Pseudomonas syringae pv. actinidiae ICMP 19079]EPN85626.1 HsdR family type I site-specific deoxyribonuclease [Pseudomonas syringae pv. actinidiae ICMP 19101]AKT27933.1 deoxyribonuclease HsdR [Pseudomonas syringae pv. actinidiae ICMP 18884]AOE54510.1 deoxyribonuclease HsdR [Pseudomonas syringae pv. actinidiae ICMP 18708]APP95375.1 deoxyribonuclease HsdR [Pseudomonas syringae p